ncbi:nucleotide exchange factor GrpE [Apibacter muscae]|nr:nucleotide exchange factor GrpE [Apibacter muscae]
MTDHTKNSFDEELEGNDAMTNESDENPENMSENCKDQPNLEDKLKEEKDRYIRLFAEFDNYKKRVTKERQDLLRYSNKDILESLLPVLDDFDRAMEELEKDPNSSAVLEGVKLIYNKLYNNLKDNGLQLIEVNPGDDFDLDFHEAITQVPAPDESLKGKIIDVVQKGYQLHEKVIRYAKVVTGK